LHDKDLCQQAGAPTGLPGTELLQIGAVSPFNPGLRGSQVLSRGHRVSERRCASSYFLDWVSVPGRTRVLGRKAVRALAFEGTMCADYRSGDPING